MFASEKVVSVHCNFFLSEAFDGLICSTEQSGLINKPTFVTDYLSRQKDLAYSQTFPSYLYKTKYLPLSIN